MKKIFLFLNGLSLLSNTIIGVGFFALPFVASKVSYLIFFYFFVLGGVVFLIHLFYGRLALITPDYKRLPGFVEYYLGKKWFSFSVFIIVFSLIGTLLSYLIVAGEFLNGIFPFLNTVFWTIVFFFFSLSLILKEIDKILKIQTFSFFFLVFLLFLLIFQGRGMIKWENFALPPKMDFWFLPYGIIIFSLWGTSVIPEIEESLTKETRKKLGFLIFSSFIFVIIFYLLFIYFVLGILGPKTTENALLGLKEIFSPSSFKLILLLGFIAVFTSFISLGLTLKRVLVFDLKIKEKSLFFFFLFLPLILFLLGFQRFLPVISFVGSVFLAIEGLLILKMYQKIKKTKIYYLLFLFLIFGVFYQIFYFFKNYSIIS
jgi:amino acid permease